MIIRRIPRPEGATSSLATSTSFTNAPGATVAAPRLPEPPAEADETRANAGPSRAKSRREEKNPDNWTPQGDYIVGKNRPPVTSRWQKGQSGNPKGKRPGALNIDTLIVEMMERTISVSTANGTERVSHADALLRKTYEKAVKGDLKATQLVLDLFAAAHLRRSKELPQHGEVTEAEQAMLDEVLAKYVPAAQAGAAQ